MTGESQSGSDITDSGPYDCITIIVKLVCLTHTLMYVYIFMRVRRDDR